MAPINPDLQSTQEDIKNVIQDLFQILAQVANYDSTSRPSREALAQDMYAAPPSFSFWGPSHPTFSRLQLPPPPVSTRATFS
jgi:hypothetical protein